MGFGRSSPRIMSVECSSRDMEYGISIPSVMDISKPGTGRVKELLLSEQGTPSTGNWGSLFCPSSDKALRIANSSKPFNGRA